MGEENLGNHLAAGVSPIKMKCFIGFFLIVLISLVFLLISRSSPMDHSAHGQHNSPQKQLPQPLHERIHLVQPPAEVRITNASEPVIPPAENATVPPQNITLLATLYANTSLEVPYDIEVPLNVSENGLGSYMKVHENCSHCLKEVNESTTKQVGCMCALFISQHPVENEVPLMSSTFHNVSCHQNVPNQEACDKVCIAVAKIHADLEDRIVCSKVQHANNLSVFLQSKICENGTTWNYTGLSSVAPICCHAGQVIRCSQ